MGNRPLISVVDDDESLRVAIRSLLNSFGWDAYAFASADEFLNSPHVHDTSCLIADVQMPGMSGIELQSALVARGHSTPVILITAFPDDRIRARSVQAGATCFLSKPFEDESLIRCVHKALKGATFV